MKTRKPFVVINARKSPATGKAIGVDLGTQERELGWPKEVALECAALREAMTPRCQVRLYVPNQDQSGQLIPVLQIIPELQREISRITGGQTTYRGLGDYVNASGDALNEDTAVIETFLPTSLTDLMSLRLTRLFVEFGRRTRQEVVLVGIGVFGFWIPTGLLLETARGGLLSAG